jgi:hypothetical protein
LLDQLSAYLDRSFLPAPTCALCGGVSATRPTAWGRNGVMVSAACRQCGFGFVVAMPYPKRRWVRLFTQREFFMDYNP